MKKYLIIGLMVFIMQSAICAKYQLKPKIFFDIEQGERFMEVEDDYTDYDYDIEKSYRYTIIKAGYKQDLTSASEISVIIKNNNKEFSYIGDKKFDNYANSALSYFKTQLTETLQLKLETNILKRKFDEFISADKNNFWYTAGVSFKITPKSATNFFTKQSNVYNLKIHYKNQQYSEAHNKDASDAGVSGNWEIKLTSALKLESRANYSFHRFSEESAARQNSDKYNVGVRFEYDFNK